MSCGKCENCSCGTSLIHLNTEEFNNKISLLSIAELKALSLELKSKVQTSVSTENESSFMSAVKKLASVYRVLEG